MYEQIARFYDLTHATLQEDMDLILKLAASADGPILELGCGTGRLLLPLAQVGYRVTGVDNSSAMLDRARQKLAAGSSAIQARVTLLEQDMVNLEGLGQDHFSLALISYNTALHFPPAQLSQILRGVGERLGENGRLFLDLANPFLVAATPNDRYLTLENQLTDPLTGEIILQQASNWLDEDAQTLQVTWIYDVMPHQGGPIQRTVIPVTYHYLYPHEVELLLTDAGYKLLALWGDYDENSFAAESPRLLVLAEPR